ncbi:DUF6192 family protein [Streptomyces mirabilis]|uniref:DUF6192 family protein n=1 Tax=Streptomyces mirabilis TaxID=68239 RepID=UPI00368B71FA
MSGRRFSSCAADLSDDEQAVLAQNVARCRATLDWIETAAETGEVDMDDERLPESVITWAAITLMTRRLTRRKAQPATRRDISPYYLAHAA